MRAWPREGGVSADEAASLRLTIREQQAEIGRLRTALRVNALRWGYSDSEIDAILNPNQSEGSGVVMDDQNKALTKLLRAIANGSQAKENRHDVIFNAAADKIEGLIR